MKYLAYKLTMPHANTVSGRWTREKDLHCRVQRVREANWDNVKRLVGNTYFYDFSDGWVAQIDVTLVNEKRAKELKRQSTGFCGYEWMIKSILTTNEITVEGGRQECVVLFL